MAGVVTTSVKDGGQGEKCRDCPDRCRDRYLSSSRVE
jgi:hypothetical protein